MYLNGKESLCEKNQKIIVSKDSGSDKRHIAKNAGGNSDVRQFQLDGDIFKQETVCDYLVLNDTKRNAYFVELKGSDITHGVEQLEAASQRFQKELESYVFFYRLVCSRVNTHAVNGSKFLKFKKKHYGYFAYKEGKLEEDI